MSLLPPDPWQKVRTEHDMAADELISAMQKEIRRGNTENAADSKTDLIFILQLICFTLRIQK